MTSESPHPVQSWPLALVIGGLTLAGNLGSATHAQVQTTLNFQVPPMTTFGHRIAREAHNPPCIDPDDPVGMVALVPDTNIGLTLHAAPDLFVYVPANSAEVAEFRLLKEPTGEKIYGAQFALPLGRDGADYRHPGAIVKLPLASEPVTLVPGESYLWAIALVCDRHNRATDIAVDVVIQRAGGRYLNTLSGAVLQQLAMVETLSGEDRVRLYSAAGLWHDALSELSTLVATTPRPYATTWAQFLADQGIDNVADAPLYESDLRLVPLYDPL